MAIFISLMLAMFVSSLAETMTATALPTIVGDLGGVEIMQWVTTAYIMGSTITMPIYGKLGDLIGRKFLIMTALGIYIIGSGICSIAPSMEFLIIGRTVSGLGGGGLLILTQATIADVVPARQRGKYLGLIGSVFSVSTVIGPLLGGWFVQVTGWRWLFVFNMPLASAAIVAIGFFLKQKMRKLTSKVDVWGMTFMTLAIVSLVLAISWVGTVYRWDSPEVLTAVAVFIVAAILFVRTENRAEQPVIPMSLFKNRNFVLVTTTGFIIMVGQMGTTSYLPTYLQIVHGLSPEQSGLMIVPMVAGVLITAVGTGFIASATGRYKWMPIACCFVTALGFLLLSRLDVNSSLVEVGIYLFILGFGIGLGQQILVLIVQNEFPHNMVGTATAGNNFFRQIGSTVGASFVGAMFTSRLTADIAAHLPKADNISINAITPSSLHHMSEPVREVIINGYSDALVPIFVYFIPMLVVGIILTCLIKEHPLATTVEHGGHPKDEL